MESRPRLHDYSGASRRAQLQVGQGPYEVRFAVTPSVEGAKCTLDGEVKYSEKGIASFFNLEAGDHSYSVEKAGMIFVKGKDPLGRSLGQSGVTTIEYYVPGFEWPPEHPWVLVLEFKAVALADFGITRLEANKAAYDVGESVSVAFEVVNRGTGQDGATVEVFEAETGAKLKTFVSEGDIRPGEKFSKPAAVIGSMPDREWRLRFKVKP